MSSKGVTSTAGQRLFLDRDHHRNINQRVTLHLTTSNRSLRADNLAQWVNLVLDGKPELAKEIGITQRFPIFLSRDLNQTRSRLKTESLAESRFGLAGSSGAARLRAEGLEPSSTFHAKYPWHHWYLAPRSDLRSSFACEVFATEFEIQGLELDWVGLCWGGDFIWSGSAWVTRNLHYGRQSKWSVLANVSLSMRRDTSARGIVCTPKQLSARPMRRLTLLHIIPIPLRNLHHIRPRLFNHRLASQSRVQLNIRRRLHTIQLQVLCLANPLRAFLHMEMACRTSTNSTARMIQKYVIVLRHIQK